jgi:raffinose/stachyose/melibiose transport system permease protein
MSFKEGCIMEEKKKNALVEFFSRRAVQKWVIVILFLIIPIALLVVFTYLPLFDMVGYSFFKWNGTSKQKTWIGLNNYIEVFTRPEYLKVLKTSIYYFIGSIVQIILALFFATILNYKIKGRNFFKGVIFFPSLLNGVAIGLIFLLFYKGGGTLDSVLTMLGIPQQALPLWLGDVALVNISLVFVSVWRYMGQNMVMFNGAIQSVNTELLEAASLDGANKWQQFWYIILPNIKTIVSLNLILAVKGAISVYEIPMIMTNGANQSATFVMKTLDTAFTSRKIGLASAMGVVLLVFIMIVTFIQKRFIEGKEED